MSTQARSSACCRRCGAFKHSLVQNGSPDLEDHAEGESALYGSPGAEVGRSARAARIHGMIRAVGWESQFWESDTGREPVREWLDALDDVKQAAAVRGLSIVLADSKELSEAAGVQQSEISRIERGQGNPTMDTLSKIVAPLHGRLALVDDDGRMLTA